MSDYIEITYDEVLSAISSQPKDDAKLIVEVEFTGTQYCVLCQPYHLPLSAGFILDTIRAWVSETDPTYDIGGLEFVFDSKSVFLTFVCYIRLMFEHISDIELEIIDEHFANGG